MKMTRNHFTTLLKKCIMFENNFARADPLCGKISAARPRNARGAATRKAIMTNYFDDIVKNLAHAVTYDSSQSPAKEGMPFGEGAAKCLEFYLSLADFMGFDTKNYDNYAGEVRWGEGKDFAVLAHLDVVPAGSGWTHAPFGGEIDNAAGRIWGRGTMDDKGPAIIALYAMYALKEEGFRPRRTIKLILGCNEENGWACIDHYNKVAVMPEEGISPDADFPVIYAEKGIMQIKFAFKADGACFSGLKGGNRPNMVCDYCEARVDEGRAEGAAEGIELADGLAVSRGRSAHGSTPEKGVNAIPAMLTFLGLDDVKKVLFDDMMGLKGLEDETGPLTFSPNMIEQSGDRIYVTCDVRYPATYARERIIEILDAQGREYEITHEQAPLFNDRDSNLISTLLSVYNEVTGKDAKPIAIGGGTYARALKFGAAFGPEEEGEESTIHQADEYITFEKIKKCFEIYKLALKRLCG